MSVHGVTWNRTEVNQRPSWFRLQFFLIISTWTIEIRNWILVVEQFNPWHWSTATREISTENRGKPHATRIKNYKLEVKQFLIITTEEK